MAKKDKEFVKEITLQSQDYSSGIWMWYKSSINGLCPVKGCMVIRPYGYTLGEYETEAGCQD